MLSVEELYEIEKDILEEFPVKITEILTESNREGKLEDLLKALKMDHLLKSSNKLETLKNGNILIVGESEIKENEIYGICKKFNIDKDRLETCLDYKKIKTFNFKKLEYSGIYRIVLAGPMPHSTHGKEESSSAITNMENNRDKYPRVERLISNNDLKITKSNLKEMFKKLTNEDYI